MPVKFSEFIRDSVFIPGGKKINVPGRLQFNVSGIDVSIVSGLRRSIMADVQTPAFRFDPTDPEKQDVRVTVNSGAMHNELIGDRVGLIPLALSKEDLLRFKPDHWRYDLDVHNTGKRPLDVTTENIKPIAVDGNETFEFFKPDPITKHYPIIAVLLPGQRLAFEAFPSFGTGSEHARFNPSAACAFHPVQDKEAVEAERKRREDKPTFDALDAKRIVKLDDDGKVATFTFFLESQCGMSSEEIVEAGFETLAEKLRSVAEATEGNSKVTDVAGQTHCPPDIKSLKIDGEDHTVGAILQNYAHDTCEFAGYFVPHQLEKSIVVRMKTDDARKTVKDACEKAAMDVENILDAFKKATKKG